ncbi:hypothetical protein SAMN06265377_1744 [Flagellimonas pacifica]|uniref:Uncharacterized protein n=1 Tax=Flagellimonas pacifica TaxID=1247520 RepID=A0A285MRW1_9FLAO|nr:hypothetical protein SAMN06265377_1744 [Allomuricauda parva]
MQEIIPFHTHFAATPLPFRQKEYSITFLKKLLERKKSKKIGLKNFAFTKAKLHNAEHYSTNAYG